MPKEKNSFNFHKFLDETVEKIVDFVNRTPPAKSIRGSQILTAVFGLLGFAIFMEGVENTVDKLPSGLLIIIGMILMAVSGVLLQKLFK